MRELTLLCSPSIPWIKITKTIVYVWVFALVNLLCDDLETFFDFWRQGWLRYPNEVSCPPGPASLSIPVHKIFTWSVRFRCSRHFIRLSIVASERDLSFPVASSKVRLMKATEVRPTERQVLYCTTSLIIFHSHPLPLIFTLIFPSTAFYCSSPHSNLYLQVFICSSV